MSRNNPDLSSTTVNFEQAELLLSKDIVIVDDTVENLRVLSNMLSDEGYKVRKATGGIMALKVVASLAPDLILLDIMMPDLSGFEVCQQLKNNPTTASIPVIFLSALDDTSSKVKGFQLGAVDYISKPFQIDEVLVRVRNQLTLRAAQQKISQLNAQLEAQVQERTKQLMGANSRLLEMAHYDSLTGLANRNMFMELLEEALHRSKIDSAFKFAVLFLDCDRFKVINDSLGHLLGDQLLQEMSHPLRGVVRHNDTLARLGGDEFAIILADIPDLNASIHVAERILESLKQPFYLNDYDIHMTVSIGIVLSSSHYEKPEQLLRDADIAMYRAKKSGRGQYQVFSSEMHQDAHKLLELETDLHRAIAQEEFTVHYQPIINLNTGKIAGFEALVRWLHPKRGLIPPGAFLPVAEETGLICSIGSWVMRQACHQIYQWQQQQSEPLRIYINLAAQQLIKTNLIDEIDQILAETQLKPESIKLEITESSMIQNLASTRRLLKQLCDRGIDLSIDDFGTGYSSLGQLQSFPVQTLKIDRSFIQRLDGTTQSLGLIPIILSIAKVTNMDVVAEGIETQQQLDQLRQLETNFGQGFFFSKPIDADSATQLMAQNPQW
ncbi:two-component system response regulator [Merismopedia glauca]|uniref:GGDEF domain-containing response regulator n=1 Tax=Merismopedia glauca CCAP 1448/3 TaxID=1296344 RepID=A0A2T1BXN8_9CYAN|nr:GGDEF domain-containing response regulator [Merismopedia glauca]PSB00718.1 GGDEF domain-containing response regulator [Merismopedia glauca CCAP 1448/3]